MLQLQDDEAAFIGRPRYRGLPNVFCCERNYANRHDEQCSHLHPEIIGESGFVAGLRIHLRSPPSRLSLEPCGDRAFSTVTRRRAAYWSLERCVGNPGICDSVEHPSLGGFDIESWRVEWQY